MDAHRTNGEKGGKCESCTRSGVHLTGSDSCLYPRAAKDLSHVVSTQLAYDMNVLTSPLAALQVLQGWLVHGRRWMSVLP